MDIKEPITIDLRKTKEFRIGNLKVGEIWRGFHIIHKWFFKSYTVTIRGGSSSSSTTNYDFPLILKEINGTIHKVRTSINQTFTNIVSMQLEPISPSIQMNFSMGGKQEVIANKGSGNPSDVLYLTGDVIIDWNRYSAPEQSCILADTLILMADRKTLKPIGDIKVGDEILSYDWSTGKLIANPVIYASSQDDTIDWNTIRYYKRTFEDGTVIKNAFAHRFYNVTQKGFIHLDYWEQYDSIYKQDGTTTKLMTLEKIYEPCKFARITGKYGTNYFANGCLSGDSECPNNLDLSKLEKLN